MPHRELDYVENRVTTTTSQTGRHRELSHVEDELSRDPDGMPVSSGSTVLFGANGPDFAPFLQLTRTDPTIHPGQGIQDIQAIQDTQGIQNI